MDAFDVVVIGAGPGGYVCAFRAQQLGLKVALVEKRATLGGTCLNIGCIPSKALLHTSEKFAWARRHAAESGIKLAGVEADLPAILQRKDAVVARLVGGVGLLAKSRRIPVFQGTARFISPSEITVGASLDDARAQRLTAKHFVIATGSAPVELPFMKFDGRTIVSSDEALSFPAVPKKLVVVGGGAIGLELGSVWARFGSEVTVVEFLPKIVATYDDDIVRAFTRLLAKQGLRIETGARVTGFQPAGSGGGVPSPRGVLMAERDGQKLEFEADQVLVAVGRRPYTDGLGLEKAGVELDERKRIKVDDHLRTAAKNIWAIGDVIAGPMLAHKAEEDGVAVAEWIAGKAGHINWNLVPGIVYTEPEVASVGLGEDEAKKRGLAVNVGKFNFAANGRAIAIGATDGFVKIIADARTDRILGAQILGYNAGEIISEVVTHMEYGGSAEDLGRTIHAHPTVSESLKEAGLAVGKSALHAL